MLTIRHLSVAVEKKKILDDVSIAFKPGTVYALMGPNGSGKSTLANALMGHPDYTLGRGSRITFGKRDLTRLTPDRRAGLGLFLSFQNPLPLPGVSVKDLLRLALEKKYTPLERSEKITRLAKVLGIQPELLSRSLNEGFSGGEKKKLEALQAILLAPRVAIFDELDTGVDVDAVKKIARALKRHLPRTTTLVFITHSTRLLKYLRPQAVIVMKAGRIVATGRGSLAEKIEKKGFDQSFGTYGQKKS